MLLLRGDLDRLQPRCGLVQTVSRPLLSVRFAVRRVLGSGRALLLWRYGLSRLLSVRLNARESQYAWFAWYKPTQQTRILGAGHGCQWSDLAPLHVHAYILYLCAWMRDSLQDSDQQQVTRNTAPLWHGPAAGAVSSIASRVLTCKKLFSHYMPAATLAGPMA